MGLVALWHVESSWTRDGIHVHCIGRWVLIHCATGEVPPIFFWTSLARSYSAWKTWWVYLCHQFLISIHFVLCPSTFQALILLRVAVQLLPRNTAVQLKPYIQAADWSQRPWPWAVLLCSNLSHLRSATIKTFRSLGRFLPLMIT